MSGKKRQCPVKCVWTILSLLASLLACLLDFNHNVSNYFAKTFFHVVKTRGRLILSDIDTFNRTLTRFTAHWRVLLDIDAVYWTLTHFTRLLTLFIGRRVTFCYSILTLGTGHWRGLLYNDAVYKTLTLFTGRLLKQFSHSRAWISAADRPTVDPNSGSDTPLSQESVNEIYIPFHLIAVWR